MASYYVNQNAQSNGDHEVHKAGCSYRLVAADTLRPFGYNDGAFYPLDDPRLTAGDQEVQIWSKQVSPLAASCAHPMTSYG